MPITIEKWKQIWICLISVFYVQMTKYFDICDLLWQNKEQVGVKSFSLSRTQQYSLLFIQYNHLGYSYLEAIEIPFKNQGLPWLLLKESLMNALHEWLCVWLT